MRNIYNYNDFYNSLSIESGIIDVTAIKQMYHGLERIFEKRLRQNATVRLPGIGEFNLKVIGKTGNKTFKGKLVKPYQQIMYSTDRALKRRVKTWE